MRRGYAFSFLFSFSLLKARQLEGGALLVAFDSCMLHLTASRVGLNCGHVRHYAKQCTCQPVRIVQPADADCANCTEAYQAPANFSEFGSAQASAQQHIFVEKLTSRYSLRNLPPRLLVVSQSRAFQVSRWHFTTFSDFSRVTRSQLLSTYFSHAFYFSDELSLRTPSENIFFTTFHVQLR